MPNIIIKDRNRLVRCQKDIIDKVNRLSRDKRGTDSRIKEAFKDYKQVSKEHNLPAKSIE